MAIRRRFHNHFSRVVLLIVTGIGSSQALKGPNIREDIDTLKNHSWDVYRLNRWDRVDKKRFYEFVNLVRQKAERWYGYDFPGLFGLWNSNLRPIKPQD